MISQTRNAFNIRFRPQRKDHESSYLARQILALFRKLVAQIVG